MIPQPLQRIKNFQKLGFGMFVHYGIYSVLGKGEWAKKILNIPDAEYDKNFSKFTAENFNAEELVLTAKRAGMKYITLTTRHHDGFSLYDTRGLNSYDAPHAPCGRDLIAEFVAACRKYAIVPFFYHTSLDWREKSYKENFKTYLKYLRDSIEVLCRNYGKIGGFWFDGNWDKPDADWEEDALYGLIRKYQPDAILVNNTGLGALGKVGHLELDSVTFERGKPQAINQDGSPKYLAAEMCQILNSHWGYTAQDFHYKSVQNILEDLCQCRKYGANFLLNIGPRGDGSLSHMDAAILEMVGQWIKINQKAIYEVRPCTIISEDKDFVLRGNNGKYYLFVHDLCICGDLNVVKDGGMAKQVKLSGLKGKCKSIEWLDCHDKVPFEQEGDELLVKAQPFIYGENLVVRIAEIEIE